MRKIVILALATAVLASCGGDKTSKKSAVVEQAPAAILTKAEVAVDGTMAIIESYTSEILPFVENDITPAANGIKVDKIYVDVGDKVRKGQLLASLDPTQYNQQLTNLKTLEVDYNRLKNVYEAGGISKQTLDQTKASLDIQTEALKDMKKNINVLSPISGVVTARNTEAGNLFMAQPILHVMQIDRVKVLVNVSEEYFPNVKIGMPVVVSTEIYPNEVFEGKVSLIAPTLNPQSRTFAVEVTVPNSDGRLRPGMYAKSTFEMGEKSAVLITDVAVQKQMGSSDKFVYVITPDSKAEYRKVKVGRQNGSAVDILSGLEAGEKVAITALTKINDGSTLDVK